MRILTIADIHSSEACIHQVHQYIRDYSPDLLVACGDITQFGPGSWAKDFFDDVPIPSLAIPGNCDPEEVMTAIEASKATLLHKKRCTIDGVTFVGLGGSKSTPTEMSPMELSEAEIYDSLKAIMVPNAVLVVHSPPKGHLDRTEHHVDLGSESIASIVQEFSPRLVLSAHFHESRGVEVGNGTTFVNPGPALKGCAAIVDVNDEIKAKLINV